VITQSITNTPNIAAKSNINPIKKPTKHTLAQRLTDLVAPDDDTPKPSTPAAHRATMPPKFQHDSGQTKKTVEEEFHITLNFRTRTTGYVFFEQLLSYSPIIMNHIDPKHVSLYIGRSD
jgi:hypothetical protein